MRVLFKTFILVKIIDIIYDDILNISVIDMQAPKTVKINLNIKF